MIDGIAIVGGGASGALLTLNILREGNGRTPVLLVERRGKPGYGFAYSTRDPAHLLNVRAANMSAFPSEPDHFRAWLSQRLGAEVDGGHFAPRADYGAYLAALLQPHVERGRLDGSLRIVEAECIRLEPVKGGMRLVFADGRMEEAGRVVLATGHDEAGADVQHLASPWSAPLAADAKTARNIVVLGAGLSMVDTVVSLLNAGFAGQVTAISRHGFTPNLHAPAPAWSIAREDIPITGGPLACLLFLRAEIARATASGAQWRSVVDALRPHTQAIWKGFDIAEKARFVRHLRAHWDVVRHRMAPAIGRQIEEAKAQGVLTVKAGAFVGAEAQEGRVAVTFRPRGGARLAILQADRVYDCRGVTQDPLAARLPLMRQLVEAGLVRPDPLGLSLDVDETGAALGRDGAPDPRLTAIGPLTRSRFWEVTAVPDIRVQAVELARRLLA